MSGVALLLKSCGIALRGTDIRKSAITDLLQREGVELAFAPKPQWAAEAAWVCMPYVFPKTHVERLAAEEANRIILTRNQALSIILSEFCKNTVAVVGTLARALCAKAVAIGSGEPERWGWCVGALSRDDSLHAQLGQNMAVEFDERDALDDCLPNNTSAIVVSDWQSDSLAYYDRNDMLESIIDVAVSRGIPCIYPISRSAKHIGFCAMSNDGRLPMDFDIRQTQGFVHIGLPHPFMPRVLKIRGGMAEASAVCAALFYLLYTRHPSSKVYEALHSRMSSLQFIGWYEKRANLIHDVRMHPVGIRQSLANIRETFVLPPAVVLKPYALTLRAYEAKLWGDVFRGVSQCNLLPPYEGASSEELQALSNTLQSVCEKVCITSTDEVAQRMLNDVDRPWLWIGADDILPQAFL